MTDTETGSSLARSTSWLHPSTTPLIAGDEAPSDVLARFLALERSCDRYRLWGMSTVPAPFQVPAYMNAYVTADRMLPEGSLPEAEATGLAANQSARLQNLVGRAHITVALSESAFLAELGGRAGLLEQIEFLRILDARDDVDILVLPFNAGPHRGVYGDFYLMDFSDQAPNVFFEAWTHSRCTSDPKLFQQTSTIFEEIRAKCVPLGQFPTQGESGAESGRP